MLVNDWRLAHRSTCYIGCSLRRFVSTKFGFSSITSRERCTRSTAIGTCLVAILVSPGSGHPCSGWPSCGCCLGSASPHSSETVTCTTPAANGNGATTPYHSPPTLSNSGSKASIAMPATDSR